MAAIIKANSTPSGAAPFQFGELRGNAPGPCESDRRETSRAGEFIRLHAGDEHATQAPAETHGNGPSPWPAIRAAVEELQAAKSVWLAHWERTAMHVAVAIAERVVRRELAAAPEITMALVREALELAAGSAELVLRLNPEDFNLLGDQAQRMAAELTRLGKVDVVADPAISKGGCRVDTRHGTIDQQLQVQLARIEAELTS